MKFLYALLKAIDEVSRLGKYPAIAFIWALSFVYSIHPDTEAIVGGVLSLFFGILIITLATIGLWTII